MEDPKAVEGVCVCVCVCVCVPVYVCLCVCLCVCVSVRQNLILRHPSLSILTPLPCRARV